MIPFLTSYLYQKMTTAFIICTLVIISNNLLGQEPETIHLESKKLGVNIGWVYGLGGEVEYRPNKIGVSLGGGYVPSYNKIGGYLGLIIAQNKIDQKGAIMDIGTYYGFTNPYRSHADGLGGYILLGYNFHLLKKIPLKLLPGFGLPFQQQTSPEILVKLTVGII